MTSLSKLVFSQCAKRPSKVGLLDAFTTLHHYCQVNYLVDPSKLKAFIPSRFQPLIIHPQSNQNGKAIISAVIFEEQDFHLKKFKPLKFTFN
jgi:hypothetical protein